MRLSKQAFAKKRSFFVSQNPDVLENADFLENMYIPKKSGTVKSTALLVLKVAIHTWDEYVSSTGQMWLTGPCKI